MEKKDCLHKLKPNAWIGYLVGYESTNIYRVWNPNTNTVIRVHDVMYNEDEIFSGDKKLLKDDLLSITNEEMHALLQQCEFLPQPLPALLATSFLCKRRMWKQTFQSTTAILSL
jgi:hypothetical protein